MGSGVALSLNAANRQLFDLRDPKADSRYRPQTCLSPSPRPIEMIIDQLRHGA